MPPFCDVGSVAGFLFQPLHGLCPLGIVHDLIQKPHEGFGLALGRRLGGGLKAASGALVQERHQLLGLRGGEQGFESRGVTEKFCRLGVFFQGIQRGIG